MGNTEQPEWTSTEREMLDYIGTLDRISRTIACVMNDTLPFETVRKLLPLADIACREKDPRGALVFFDIGTPSPSVKYYPDSKSVTVALLGHSSNRYVLPLHPVLELSMGPVCSKKTQ
jgi:hypothetical protein